MSIVSSNENDEIMSTAVWSGAEAEKLIAGLAWDKQGLIPTIVQDAVTQEVLMLAYMSEQSLKMSCELGETVFWSRSRQELWHKGATSGHTQRIVSMAADCDKDTLLIQVHPNGPSCHTGSVSCFYETMGGVEPITQASLVPQGSLGSLQVLAELEATIAQREQERPEGAYTTYLFDKGVDKVLKKIGEESAEVIIAAKGDDSQELVGEASDLMFHLLVLLKMANISLEQIMAELARRHAAPRREDYNEAGKLKV